MSKGVAGDMERLRDLEVEEFYRFYINWQAEIERRIAQYKELEAEKINR